jgi:hypothetical protein
MEAEGEMSIFETEEKRGGGKDHIGSNHHRGGPIASESPITTIREKRTSLPMINS